MKKHLLILLSPMLMLTSCMQDGMFDEIRVKVETSAPIGSLNFTDKTLFELSKLDNILTVGKDGVLKLGFNNNISLINEGELSNFFSFPSQKLVFDVETGMQIPPFIAPGATVTIPANKPIKQILKLDMPSDKRIDQISFANGSVSIKINAGVDVSRVRWRIPELVTSSGTVVSGMINDVVRLDGCTLSPTIQNLDNNITVEFYGESPLVSEFSGELNIVSDSFSFLKGFLGRTEINIDPISVDLGKDFDDFTKYVEQAYFANPRITLNVESGFDVPILLSIRSISVADKTLALSPDLMKTNFLITKGKTSILIDNSISSKANGLSELINISSKSIKIKLGAVANPSKSSGDAIDGGSNVNVLKKSDVLNGEYAVTIPLDGYLKNISFEEKVGKFDISNKNLDLQGMVMAFTGENRMPIDMALMAYAGSVAAGNELFDKPIVIPASKSQTAPSIIGKDNMLVAKIGKTAVNKLKASKMLLFQFKASTRNLEQKENVKFYSPTSIDLKVMLGATAEAKF